MAESIDDLSLIISASTDQLAGDLRAAARMVENFSKVVGRDTQFGFAKHAAADLAAVRGIRQELAGVGATSRLAAAATRGLGEMIAAPFRGLDRLVRGISSAKRELTGGGAIPKEVTVRQETVTRTEHQATAAQPVTAAGTADAHREQHPAAGVTDPAHIARMSKLFGPALLDSIAGSRLDNIVATQAVVGEQTAAKKKPPVQRTPKDTPDLGAIISVLSDKITPEAGPHVRGLLGGLTEPQLKQIQRALSESGVKGIKGGSNKAERIDRIESGLLKRDGLELPAKKEPPIKAEPKAKPEPPATHPDTVRRLLARPVGADDLDTLRKTAEAINKTELNKIATEMGVKNAAKIKKDALLTAVVSRAAGLHGPPRPGPPPIPPKPPAPPAGGSPGDADPGRPFRDRLAGWGPTSRLLKWWDRPPTPLGDRVYAPFGKVADWFERPPAQPSLFRRGPHPGRDGMAGHLAPVGRALSTPFRAMTNGGLGLALTDPFIAATTAVETLAAVVETPFKLAGAAAKGLGRVIEAPFRVAGAVVEGLSVGIGGLVGMVPKVGGIFGSLATGFGKAANGILTGVGMIGSGLGKLVGDTLSVAGDAFGKFVGAVGKTAIQGLAVAFGTLKQSINMAAEAEQTRVAFETLIGSADRAHRVLADARRFAAESPFGQRDVVDSTRMLTGYGLQAEQALAVTRMLGDVAAGTAKPLKDIAYLYGTALNKAHLDTVDVRQFDQFMPFSRELAKSLGVTTDRLADMVEQGKIGSAEMTRNFMTMTASGGMFFGMVDRQKDTFSGVMEQMSDAFDLAKVKFGNVLIEELGLKEAMRDGEAFAKSIESSLDRIRPTVRLVGDLGRAVGQVAVEFGRAAGNAAMFAAEAGDGAFPEIQRAVKEFARMGRDGIGFRIDTDAVARGVFAVGRSILEVLASTLDGLNRLGQGMVVNIVEPIQRAMLSLHETRNWVKDHTPGVESATPEERFYPPKAFEKDENIIARYRELESLRAGAEKEAGRIQRLYPGETGQKMAAGHLRQAEQLGRLQREFLAESIFLEGSGGQTEENRIRGLHHLLAVEGRVPVMRDRQSTVIGDNGFLKQSAQFFRDRIAGLDSMERVVRDRIAADDEVARVNKELALAAAETRNRLLEFGVVLGGTAGAALTGREREQRTEVDIPFRPDATVLAVAKRARDQFGKSDAEKIQEEFEALKVARQIGDANELRSRGAWGDQLPGGIDQPTFDRATADLARRAQDLVGTYRLPDAAMRDSTEAVRLMNQWRVDSYGTGPKKMTTEELLKLILETLQSANQDRKARNRAINAAMPTPVPLPR